MAVEFTEKELTKIVNAVEEESSFDGEVLKLGNILEVKPVYDNNEIIGYDIYKYADEELMEDDDYDFDSDFITTVYLK